MGGPEGKKRPGEETKQNVPCESLDQQTCRHSHTRWAHSPLNTTAQHHHRSSAPLRSHSSNSLTQSITHSLRPSRGGATDHCIAPFVIVAWVRKNPLVSIQIPSFSFRVPNVPDEAVEPCALRLALPRWSASIFPDILCPSSFPQSESSTHHPCPPDPCPSYHSPDQPRPGHIGFQPISAPPAPAFLCPAPLPAGRTLSASKHVPRF
ncbi:hypothetical protein M440DRAFT_217867 [Trichoderma longibrachiatum ATCC 18648]|uniref:Uncharacterized protein n=1 Tax=Trichoderma longibrachiatum ATCC 18648 TaxID=983965 RepID=A0A2T4BQ44_TRILO|nr:hypothetical protein M440DRAFT_217867 [Trichoderma longibrachiatum ATCC 18648]